MAALLYVEINAIGIIILAIIFNSQRKSITISRPHKLFNLLTVSVIMILLFDSGMWLLDGKQFPYAYQLNWLITWFYYFFNCFVPFIWFEYTISFFNYKIKLIQKYHILVFLPVTLNLLFILLNFKYPLIFIIDHHNFYHRTEFFLLSAILAFTYLFAALLVCIRSFIRAGNHIAKQESRLMIKIFVLPLSAALLQTLCYGVSLIWICVVLSILMIFINFQNQQISTDPLTKINNRSQLDKYMQSLSERSSQTFSLIMIDIDRFKYINDTFGHICGDKVLVTVADLLRNASCGCPHSFLCRYGGDEFVMICEVSNLDSILDMLKNYIVAFNATQTNPFLLSLSIGNTNFLGSQSDNIDGIIAEADACMYQNKVKNHGL